MLLNGGELEGVRVLTPKAVREMTSDQLPPNIRFAGNALGPDTGSSWGLGFQIRTNPEHSYVPGSVGSFRWSGLWGTYFWVDPAEKLIAVEMIQAAPGKAGPAFGAIRRLTYGALRVPAPADFVAPSSPLVVSADALAEYAGKYAFASSTSAHDLQADHPRLGFEKLDVENGVFNVSRMTDGGPAMKAGVMAGDLIVQLDDLKVDSSSLDAANALLEAHDVPSLRRKSYAKARTSRSRSRSRASCYRHGTSSFKCASTPESSSSSPRASGRSSISRKVSLSSYLRCPIMSSSSMRTMTRVSPSSGMPRARLPAPC
jgi:PDZ domain/Beta-lactamase